MNARLKPFKEGQGKALRPCLPVAQAVKLARLQHLSRIAREHRDAGEFEAEFHVLRVLAWEVAHA